MESVKDVAYAKGWNAYENGKTIDCNPYVDNDILNRCWKNARARVALR